MSGNKIPPASPDHRGSPGNPKGGKRADHKSTPQSNTAVAAKISLPPAPIGAPALAIGVPANQSADGPHHSGGGAKADGAKPKSFLDVAKAAAGPARAGGKPAPPPRIKQEKPERVRAPVVKPLVKRKPQAGDLSDDEFGKELEGSAPELYANLRKQVARDHAKTWFSMEMSATPDADWVTSKAASKAPDLEQYSEIKKLTDHLARTAACSGERSFKLIQLKARKEHISTPTAMTLGFWKRFWETLSRKLFGQF